MLFFNFSKKNKKGFYDKGDQGPYEHLTELLNMGSATKAKTIQLINKNNETI